MADTITAKGNDSKFKPHPDGQFVAQCVDAINLGESVETFPGKPEKLVPKCALVFRTGEKNLDTGELIDIAQEFTVSMGEKANLRKALESWRGKPYTEQQIEEGVPIHKLAGNWALITVAQKRSRSDRLYAFVQSVVGVPAAMRTALPTFPVYERAEYWQTRKDEYAKAAKEFRAKHAAPPSDDDDLPPVDGEDDLPF
jgi:hypothetical protein